MGGVLGSSNTSDGLGFQKSGVEEGFFLIFFAKFLPSLIIFKIGANCTGVSEVKL